MSRIDGNGHCQFRQKEGYLKLYLPDGHLYEGAGQLIWENTGLSWSTMNWEHGKYVGTPMRNGGNGYSPDESDKRNYVIGVSAEELRGLGYPADGINMLVMAVRRPHNIPEEQSVSSWGMGITGKDLAADRLNIDVLDDTSENYFTQSVIRKGIIPLGNLGYRPSRLAFAFPASYRITTPEDIREKPPLNEKYLMFATEFPWLTRISLRSLTGMKDLDAMREASQDHFELDETAIKPGEYFKVIKTDGKTEPYARIGDADGIMDVGETFQTVRGNGLLPMEPILMDSTPYFIVNEVTYRMFKEFIDALYARIAEGRETLERNPDTSHYFEDKLDRSVFNPDYLFDSDPPKAEMPFQDVVRQAQPV